MLKQLLTTKLNNMCKFQVGDRVKDTRSYGRVRIGIIQSIIPGKTYPIEVEFDDRKNFLYRYTKEGKYHESEYNISLITLEKKVFPRVMMVSMSKKESSKNPLKRVVLGRYNNNYIALKDIDTLEDITSGLKVILWSNAWEIEPKQEPQVVELTIQDISEGKGVGVDPALIRIKK